MTAAVPDRGPSESNGVRPVMLFDGECRFCRMWVERWREATRGRIEFAPFQEAARRFPQVAYAACEQAVHLVEPDGRVSRGAAAIFRARELGTGHTWLARAHRAWPWFARPTEVAYQFVADHRPFFSAMTRIVYGRHVTQPNFAVAGWLFQRLLATVYTIAFVSLWVQIDGLIGPQGILPADVWLERISVLPTMDRWLNAPTLCWWFGGGNFLHVLCGAGVFTSVAAFAGFLPRVTFGAAWICYLSLVTVGAEFLSFQWDALLLETGFAALLLVPGGWFNWRRASEPSRTALWVLRLVLFKLMFLSGALKLIHGNAVWRDLSALSYHYETQPLPTWIGWWAHQLPGWVQTTSCGVMFVVELGLVFFVAGPGRLRIVACAGIALLEMLIALTGNYTFFNLLTLGLCLLLLEDRWLGALARRLEKFPRPEGSAWRAAHLATAGALAVFSIAHVVHGLTGGPRVAASLTRVAAPFRINNGYGLFISMTTERPELIIEGSNDGRTWQAYEFRWKPGDPSRRPRFVAPHQPRLDWQMWFESLGSPRVSRWMGELLLALTENRQPVIGLLAYNPFPDAPPRYIRVVCFVYRFSTPSERRATGAWWVREMRALHVPPVTQAQLQLELRR